MGRDMAGALNGDGADDGLSFALDAPIPPTPKPTILRVRVPLPPPALPM